MCIPPSIAPITNVKRNGGNTPPELDCWLLETGRKKCTWVLASGTKANFQTKTKWRVELVMLVIQGEGTFCCGERKLFWLAVSCLSSYAEWIQTIIPSFSALDKAALGQPASGFWKSVFKGDIVGLLCFLLNFAANLTDIKEQLSILKFILKI